MLMIIYGPTVICGMPIGLYYSKITHFVRNMKINHDTLICDDKFWWIVFISQDFDFIAGPGHVVNTKCDKTHTR